MPTRPPRATVARIPGQLDSRFSFVPYTPEEVVSAITPPLVEWAWLIPAWCREVRIAWEDRDSTDSAIEIEVLYEYRRAEITVLPNFLTAVDRRQAQLIHELLHVITDPLRLALRAMQRMLLKDHPELEEWTDEVYRQSEESVTCDLAAMVMDVAARNG